MANVDFKFLLTSFCFPHLRSLFVDVKERHVRVVEHNEDFTTSYPGTVSFLQLVTSRIKVTRTVVKAK